MDVQDRKQSEPSEKITGISFKMSNTSKPLHVKRKDIELDNKDYVVSIVGTSIESLNAEPEKVPLVIPLPETKGVKIHKKYLKLVNGLNKIPVDSTFENKTEDVEMKEGTQTNSEMVQPKSDSKFLELPIEAPKTLEEEAREELLLEASQIQYVDAPNNLELPLLLKFRNTDLDKIEDEDQRFKADVASRPDETETEAYEKVPIDLFGAAMLRGMGWSEGAPIGVGKNAKVTDVVDFLPRPGYRTGLGATPLTIPEPKKKKFIKPGESRGPKELQVLSDDKGNLKSIRRNGEELTPISKVGLHEGSLVGIIQGPHDGLYARVLKIFSSGEVIVRLQSSDEQVQITKEDITLVDEKKLNSSHPARIFIEEYEKRLEKEKQEQKYKNLDEKKDTNEKKDKKESLKSSSKMEKRWIFPNLVVRIISKSFQNGKYYLKKGTILDVVDSETCTLQLQENQKMIDVKQSMLETVVPKERERVMIVDGKLSGRTGVILEKPKGQGKATVQLAGGVDIERFELDSICQYVGDHVEH